MMDPGGLAQQAAMQGNMSQQAAREVSVLLSANTGPYQEEMKKAAGFTEQLAEGLYKVELQYKKLIRTMGVASISLGASMQATATGAIWSAVRFEESFARVAKTTGLQNEFGGQTGGMADFAATLGLGDNQLQQFEDEIRSLSTQIPVAVEELSYLADVAGTLGVESDNLGLFAKTAAELGAGINDLGSDQAIAGLANLIGAFGMAEEQVVHLGSSLAELANRTRGGASDMLQFGDRVAGTAVQVGMTAEEVLGLGAAISAIGVMPELGASAVTQVMTRISRAVQSGGEDLNRFADSMQMTSDEMKEMWQMQGGTAVLMRFIETLSEQGEAAAVTLQRLGLSGVNITQVFGGLAAQFHTLQEAMGISNKAFEEGAAVAELAEIRFGTVIQQLQQFRQATSEVFRSMGQGFLRSIQSMIEGATSLVNVFNEIPQPIKTAMGLFLGFGGAVAVATGSFMLFFAQFHLFFMTIHMVKALLPKVIAMMAGLGASGAAAAGYLKALVTKITTMVGLFKTSQGAFIGFGASVKVLATAIGVQLYNAMRFVLTELRLLTVAAGKFIAKDLYHAFMLIRAGSLKAGAAVGLLALPLAKIVAVAAVLSAAVWALIGGKDAWAESTEEVTGELARLAEQSNLAYDSVRKLNHELGNGMEDQEVDLAIEAKDLIDFLKELDEQSAKQFLLRYQMQLLEAGNDPDVVQRQIEELARLANQPIVFRWDLQDMRSGEGFKELNEAMANAFQDFGGMHNPADEGAFSRAFNWARGEATPLSRAHFAQPVDQFFSSAKDASTPGEIALFNTARGSILEARDQGLISGTQRDELLNEIAGLLPEEFGEDSRPWWRQMSENLERNNLFNNPRAFLGLERTSTTGDLRLDDPREMFAQVLEDDTLMDAQHMDAVANAIREVTGETRNLGDVLRSVDDDTFDEITNKLFEVQEELNQAAIDAQNVRAEFETPLGEIFFEAKGISDDQSRRRFLDAAFDALPQQIGYEEALRAANEELEILRQSGDEWGENAERTRNSIREWGEEFGKIRMNEIMVDLDSDTATGRLQQLQQLLWDISGEPWRVHVEAQVREVRRQEYDRAISEFRQGMQQYDRLIEQREDTIENHTRRMTRMEEDHGRRLIDMQDQKNKSIEQANNNHAKRLEGINKSYTKRLDDINKAEKDALEQRVEQQADAFSAIQRIQATPTADLGAMLNNMRAQNEAMEEMRSGLEQLRGMGLDQGVIDNLNLDDPKNFAQVRRMLEMAVSDPSMISDINREWARRLDISSGLAEESGAKDEIRERFDEQREAAREAQQEQIRAANEGLDEQIKSINERYTEQLERANENYARQVDDANDNHQRQLENIAEALSDLAQNSLEDINDLIERASESGLEKLQEWADEIVNVRGLMEENITTGMQRIHEAMGGEIMGRDMVQLGEFEGAGSEAAEDIRVGWHQGSVVTWRDLQRDIASGTGRAMDGMEEAVEGGVKRSHIELNRISDQDSVWDSARAAGSKGARDLSSAVVSELERGTSDIDRVLGVWSHSISDHLNPVLESVGADPIQVSSPRRSSGGGGARPNVVAADGAMLPDQAKIQRPGTLVQWAEPETGGEAFIPLASSKRQRSLAIWEETGRRLGAEFADGGFLDLPDFSALGDIGDATSKAVSHTNDKVDEFLNSLGYGVDGSDGVFRPRSGQYGGVQPWVAWSGNVINAIFGPLPGGIGGVGPRSGPSDHPTGHALDFMVGDTSSGHALGDRVSRFLMSNWVDHAVKYLIWKQRITHGGTWRDMASRGNRTADHWDHPHVSYKGQPGPNYDGPATPVNLAQPEPAREATPPPEISKEGQRPRSASPGSNFIAMANGGIDNIPAWMTAGEFVMNKDAHAHYGTEMMEALNAKRFANGGVVGNFSRSRGREPMGSGNQTDLVNALTKALANASLGRSETNNWDVKVEANDTRRMLQELEKKKRLSRLTGGETHR